MSRYLRAASSARPNKKKDISGRINAVIKQAEGDNIVSPTTIALRRHAYRATQEFFKDVLDHMDEPIEPSRLHYIRTLARRFDVESTPRFIKDLVVMYQAADSITEKSKLETRLDAANESMVGAIGLRIACDVPCASVIGWLNVDDVAFSEVIMKGFTATDLKTVVEILKEIEALRKTTVKIEADPSQVIFELATGVNLDPSELKDSDNLRIGIALTRAKTLISDYRTFGVDKLRGGDKEDYDNLVAAYDKFIQSGKDVNVSSSGSFNQRFNIDRTVALLSFFQKVKIPPRDLERVVTDLQKIFVSFIKRDVLRLKIKEKFDGLYPRFSAELSEDIGIFGSPSLMTISRLRECICQLAADGCPSNPASLLMCARPGRSFQRMITIKGIEGFSYKVPSNNDDDEDTGPTRSNAARIYLRMSSTGYNNHTGCMNNQMVARDMAKVRYSIEQGDEPELIVSNNQFFTVERLEIIWQSFRRDYRGKSIDDVDIFSFFEETRQNLGKAKAGGASAGVADAAIILDLLEDENKESGDASGGTD